MFNNTKTRTTTLIVALIALLCHSTFSIHQGALKIPLDALAETASSRPIPLGDNSSSIPSQNANVRPAPQLIEPVSIRKAPQLIEPVSKKGHQHIDQSCHWEYPTSWKGGVNDELLSELHVWETEHHWDFQISEELYEKECLVYVEKINHASSYEIWQGLVEEYEWYSAGYHYYHPSCKIYDFWSYTEVQEHYHSEEVIETHEEISHEHSHESSHEHIYDNQGNLCEGKFAHLDANGICRHTGLVIPEQNKLDIYGNQCFGNGRFIDQHGICRIQSEENWALDRNGQICSGQYRQLDANGICRSTGLRPRPTPQPAPAPRPIVGGPRYDRYGNRCGSHGTRGGFSLNRNKQCRHFRHRNWLLDRNGNWCKTMPGRRLTLNGRCRSSGINPQPAPSPSPRPIVGGTVYDRYGNACGSAGTPVGPKLNR